MPCRRASPILGWNPRYVLPIGFVQGPLLASLVLYHSPVNDAIVRALQRGVTVSVYLDDIVGSHTDENLLRQVYDDIRQACAAGEFVPNASKLTPPSTAIVAFNYDFVQGSATVTQARINEFYAERSPPSVQSFEEYWGWVASENAI